MFKTTWKTEYKGHVIELVNRVNLERLIVDGKEVARESGATWDPHSFQATIPDGNRSMKVDANTRLSNGRPGGLSRSSLRACFWRAWSFGCWVYESIPLLGRGRLNRGHLEHASFRSIFCPPARQHLHARRLRRIHILVRPTDAAIQASRNGSGPDCRPTGRNPLGRVVAVGEK